LREIRKAVERVYAATDGVSAGKKNPVQRRKAIEAEIQRLAREQSQPLLIKKRIRRDGALYREDAVKARPGVKLGPETKYDHTYVNAGNPKQKDFTSFEYQHDRKIATIDDKKGSRWKPTRVWYARSFGMGPSFLLRMTTGQTHKVAGKVEFGPDPQKLQRLTEGKHKLIEILVRRGTYQSHVVDRFEIRLRQKPEHIATLIVCDADDYSHMYRSESYDPKTGKLLAVTERKEFQKSGFPRVWIKEEHHPDGQVFRDEYIFTKTQLNSKLPPGIFQFAPPKGYARVDQRPESPIVTQSHGHQIAVDSTPTGDPIADVSVSSGHTWRVWLVVINAVVIAALVIGFFAWRARSR